MTEQQAFIKAVELKAERQAEQLLKRKMQNKRRAADRRARHEAYLSCGLVRVRGALGGVYYE